LLENLFYTESKLKYYSHNSVANIVSNPLVVDVISNTEVGLIVPILICTFEVINKKNKS